MSDGRNRPRSWEVTEGPHRAPARAMLRAVGFSEEDFGKPQVAVASSWNEVTPCNYHLDKLAALAKEGVRQGDAVPIEFTTIAVSDGIAMGHEGMKASLMSRDLIADSVELVMHAERFDALVGIAGLRQVRARHADGDGPDRSAERLPVRRHDPAGHLQGQGHHDPGRLRGGRRAREGHDRRRRAARGSSAPRARPPGRAPACTPPTRWPAVGEALGMSLPGSASPPAVDYRREVAARESGHRRRPALLELDLASARRS